MYGNYGDWPDDMDYPINVGGIFSSVVEQEALNVWIKDRVRSIEEKLKDSPIFGTTPEFEELRGELRALSSRGFLFSFRYFHECFCFFKDETTLEFVKRYFALFNDYEKKEILSRKETYVYSQPFNPKFRVFFDFLFYCNCFASFINCGSEDLDNEYYQGIKKAVYDTVNAYTALFNRTLDYNEAHFAIDNEFYQPKDKKENWYVEGWSCYVQYPSTIHEFIQEDSYEIEEEIEKREIDTFIDDTRYWDLVYEMYDKYIDEEWSGSNSEDSNTEIDWITPPTRKISLVNILNYRDYGEYIYETLRDSFICSGQIDNTKVKQLSLIEKCSSYVLSLHHVKGYFSSITDLLDGTNVREDIDHKKGLFLLFNNQLLQIVRILSLYLPSYSVFSEILQGFCVAVASEKDYDTPLFSLQLSKKDYESFGYGNPPDDENACSAFIRYENDYPLLNLLYSSMFSSPLTGEIEKLIDANVCRVKLEEDDETRRIDAYFTENKRAQLFSSFGISPKIAIFIYENYEDLISYSPWSDEVKDMYIKFLDKHGFRHDPKGDWGVGEAGYIDKCLERIKNGPDSISHKQAVETEAGSLDEIIAESGITGFGQTD